MSIAELYARKSSVIQHDASVNKLILRCTHGLSFDKYRFPVSEGGIFSAFLKKQYFLIDFILFLCYIVYIDIKIYYEQEVLTWGKRMNLSGS